MKKSIGALLAVGVVVSVLVPSTASAFSVAPSVYSANAVRQIVSNETILGTLPRTESITRIEQIENNPNLYEVTAGNCTVTVRFSSEKPHGFIGNGLPHDPQVADTYGCQQ
jgi:hypothetical protein